jgi:hypothetical protein
MQIYQSYQRRDRHILIISAADDNKTEMLNEVD